MRQKETQSDLGVADDEVVSDCGIVLTHPEVFPGLEPRSVIERHKVLFSAIGTAAVAGLGIAVGGIYATHRKAASFA